MLEYVQKNASGKYLVSIAGRYSYGDRICTRVEAYYEDDTTTFRAGLRSTLHAYSCTNNGATYYFDGCQYSLFADIYPTSSYNNTYKNMTYCYFCKE